MAGRPVGGGGGGDGMDGVDLELAAVVDLADGVCLVVKHGLRVSLAVDEGAQAENAPLPQGAVVQRLPGGHGEAPVGALDGDEEVGQDRQVLLRGGDDVSAELVADALVQLLGPRAVEKIGLRGADCAVGEMVQVGEGHVSRDGLHVRDVALDEVHDTRLHLLLLGCLCVLAPEPAELFICGALGQPGTGPRQEVPDLRQVIRWPRRLGAVLPLFSRVLVPIRVYAVANEVLLEGAVVRAVRGSSATGGGSTAVD